MIAPSVATMLVFILTDANISQQVLDKAFKESVGSSFNCVTVDGCMSTNDTVIVLANAQAGNKMITGAKPLKDFTQALYTVNLALAKMMVIDGEGSSKLIEIRVNKARSFDEAKKAALAIANSNLFKTAIYGENPNFGRIAAAVGSIGIDISEDSLKIKLGPLNKKEVLINVSLGRGNSSAVIYTSDLTPEYIKINAAYN
jgi:glutamate N-acetyltransferase/amino-acid N-acetyltransferase